MIEKIAYCSRASTSKFVIWIMRRLIWTKDHPYSFFGISIVSLVKNGETDKFTNQVCEALLLIKEYDVRLLRRITNDVERIHIFPIKQPDVEAVYMSFSRVCYLSPELFEKPLSAIAIAVIHESIHARLDHRGVMALPSRRARIERLCIQAEIDFLKKYPSTPDLEQWIRDRATQMETHYPIRTHGREKG